MTASNACGLAHRRNRATLMEPEQRATGALASQTVDVLKSTPVILAVLLLNVLFVGTLVYLAISAGSRWERIMQAALDQCSTQSGRVP